MIRSWCLSLVALLLWSGCSASTPPKAVKAGPPSAGSQASETPVAVKPPSVLPRYIAQIKREFGIVWRQTGSYPTRADAIARDLMWRPGPNHPRPLQTLSEGTDISVDKTVIWYNPPNADGTGAHLRYWAEDPDTSEEKIMIDPLDPAFDLAVGRTERLEQQVDLAALMQPKGDADTAMRALLIAKSPPEAGKAAATYYSFTALMEWVLTLREGKFPEDESELWGMALGPQGTVAGLEIYVDRENQKLLSRFQLPGFDPWMVETQFQQLPNDTRWIALSYGIPADTSTQGTLWRVM